MSRSLLLCALLAQAGCTVFLAPRHDDLGPPIDDAGVVDAGDAEGLDANVDAGDAGTDAGTDGGPMCALVEDCNDPMVDHDCDGFPGCEDLDCANSATCCSAGAPFILGSGVEDWGLNWNLRWDTLPTGNPPMVTGGIPEVVFGSDTTTRAVRYLGTAALGDCAPLAYGFSTDIMLHPGPTVAAGDFASFVLAQWTGIGVSAPDLEVRFDGAGLHALSGGADLAPPFMPTRQADGTIFVRVEISPGASGSAAVLLVRVTAGPSASSPSFVTGIADQPFAQLSSLLPAATCHGQAPGLYYELVGRGSSVHVRVVSAKTLACANPSQFQTYLGTAPTFGTFAAGGVAAPALMAYGSGSGRAYDLLVDASSDPRENEALAPVQFGLGQASGSALGGWPPASWMGAAAAFLPDATASRREPSAFVQSPTPLAFFGVLAQADTPTSAYGLRKFHYGPGATLGVDAAPFAPDAACTAQRDPAIVRDTRGDPAGPVLLLYTCEHVGAEPEIRAVELSPTTFAPLGAPPTVVLHHGASGYALRGVRGPEALLRYDSTTRPHVRLRVYYVAIGASVRTLAMAQGQGDDVAGALTTLAPFAGNPILLGGEADLGGCAADHCEITGLGIVRDPATPLLREILARRVDSSTTGVSWELVPATQTLETFW